MFGFIFGFVAAIAGLALRLALAFGFLVLKLALALCWSLLKVLASSCQGIGRLAAKGFKALAAARERRRGDEAKSNGCMKAA